ncbi:hypothetical protein [Sphingomonas sp. KR3-1]|uniref:hypothetical protein n=1 Tax=Sphingomonas sp. KR3-1 TaxID=3156611 RepID=UPI0032B5A10B
MRRSNKALLLAAIASGAVTCVPAQAQRTMDNDGERALHGTGSSSIERELAQELNCVAGYSDLGRLGGGLVAIPEPTNLPAGGTFNCSSATVSGVPPMELFPLFLGRYISATPDVGRSSWVAAGTLTSTPPFASGTANPFGTWTRVQFAFTDSSPVDNDFNAYVGGAPLALGGAPILFPKFVLPIAVAYSPIYGHNVATNSNYSFNIQFPQPILGTSAGGLRMSQSTYCGVFNGTIINFNNSAFTTDNGGVSLMDPADASESPGRWAADGVPVRLVGRLDLASATDILTRALAEQCGSVASGNHYAQNAETLPYKRSDSAMVRPVFDSVLATTGLQTASTAPEAGNGLGQTMVGAEYWNGSAIVTPVANVAKVSSQPGSPLYQPGLFLVADGDARVASAIKAVGGGIDYDSPFNTAVKLNGKIGYIGANFIDGSPSAAGGLKAAALQNNTTGVWTMPSSMNANNAIRTILPPQSNTTLADGTFDDSVVDPRLVRVPGYLRGGIPGFGPATRDNPFAWYDVLYAGASGGLANPSAGYPITGTIQFLGYTCYRRDASGSNAAAMVNFLNFNTDYASTVDSNGVDRKGIFTRVGASFISSGLLMRSNISPLPDPWKHAVRQTFLVNSGETSSVNTTLGGYRLWMAETNGSAASPNSNCTGKAGI